MTFGVGGTSLTRWFSLITLMTMITLVRMVTRMMTLVRMRNEDDDICQEDADDDVARCLLRCLKG